MLLAAKPNGGKTTVVLNIILRAACGKVPFEKIVVVHCDPSTTQEYKDVEHECTRRHPETGGVQFAEERPCVSWKT